ncbi:MAG: hypothetical protein AB7U82_27735 [Blastocatellales bacterium]
MIVEKVEGRYGVTINVGDYNNVKIDVGMIAQLEPADNPADCVQQLREMARREVDRQVQEIQRAGVRVHDLFASASIASESKQAPRGLPRPEPAQFHVEDTATAAVASSDAPAVDAFAEAVLAACVKAKKNDATGKAFYDGFMSKQSREKQAKFTREQGLEIEDAPPPPNDKLKALVADLIETGADVAKIDGAIANVCDGESQIEKLSAEQVAKAQFVLSRMMATLQDAG